jgi:two-component system response regulator YesN
VINYRLEKAKRLLSANGMLIYQVAEQCGFKSHRRFDEVFNRIEGITPSEYRRREANKC